MSTPSEAPYFTVLDETATGGRYLSGPGTAGPWLPDLQHGGPPNALLVRAAERAAAGAADAADELVALRYAAEFLRAVPVAEVTVEAEVVRAARTAVLVEARLSAGGRPCLHGRVWLLRRSDTTALAAPLPEATGVPSDLPDLGGNFPYHDTIEWQSLTPSIRAPGPGQSWARPRVPVVSGESMSGLQRVVLVGDSASGISSELEWDEWSFANVDLDVHLSRPVEGEWVFVDARTTLGPTGSALARSTVSDVHGEVGATLQTLVIVPRQPVP